MSNSFVRNAAYGILDLVTFKKGIARKVNGMKVRFTPRWSRYYTAEYETDNYQFLKTHLKPGMQVIDIGAHIGLFSVCSSQLVGPTGKVICFEPTPGTYNILKQTLHLNHCTNVMAIQAAVSAQEGKTIFYVSNTEGCNDNSLIKNKSEKDLNHFEVDLVSIDGIVRKYNLSPALVKVDAEGAELDVLKGLDHTMITQRPMIILGLHPAFIAMKGDSLKQIWDIIKKNRYRVVYEEKEMDETGFVSQDNLFDVQLLPE